MDLKTTHIDWLNIALMLGSASLAAWLPFEVFLFSYAVLGPLHYLTEISWLHERRYFATGKFDFLWLLALGGGLFVVTFMIPWSTEALAISWGAGLTYLAFMSALAMVLFKELTAKIIFVLVAFMLLLGFDRQQAYLLFFAVFLPTLVHVYIFTAAFMLYGALKSGSRPGLLAVVMLFVCGGALLFLPPTGAYAISEAARETYRLFEVLNHQLLVLLGLGDADLYQSRPGIALMRFIAFAYTYHYLNWFSKTSIIKWHQVSWRRLGTIVALWLASVALYAHDYRYGFVALYTLSFLHVYLEFPLNHQCFVGIGRELAVRWRGPSKPVRRGGRGAREPVS
ncbi:MAG TPA: hypothetical protein PKD86_14650 [Gemmatales bacterium]|nr:hypothetical protein [Gemmatales bacterium]HMP60584.1 hypothetical protein [Gemmatales bacterium]